MTPEMMFATRRRRMIDGLRQSVEGITEEILSAIGSVPREMFCSATYSDLAYDDRTIPIDAQQTLSKPSTVAREMVLLGAKRGEKVLEIGTGSGYQTACLYAFGLNVYSIERQERLYNATSVLLRNIGVRASLHLADGRNGLPDHAPFDRIIVTAAAMTVPKVLLSQLRVGGVCVLPLELNNAECRYYRIVRKDADNFHADILEKCSFVPMLHGVSEE